MMGAQSSKERSGENPSPPPMQMPLAVQMTSDPQYSADLSEYEAACRADPDLQSFDNIIHERTTHVMGTLVSGVEVSALSFDSLKEVTNSLLDMNQEVVKVILKCKEDIWNNKDIFALVEQYFDNSIKTLDFCSSLEGYLRRARNSQLLVQVAVRQFEEEAALQDGVTEKKYVRTLEQLNKFKAAGDPFPEEFFTLFNAVHREQLVMLHKLQAQKRKLDKKLKSMKIWRRVSNVVFVTAFVSVLIFSVVAAAIAAPPFVTALASALAVPIGSVGKWCDTLWNRYRKTLKGQREIVSTMEVGTFITIKDMDNIRVLVNKLEVDIESFLQTADFALRDEDTLKLVIHEMKKKLEVFTQNIEVLVAHTEKCSRDIRQARTVILQRIIRYPEQ